MRAVATLSVAGAVPAVIGGALFGAISSRVTVTHAIASGLWIAAAVLLLSMFLAATKSIWRRTMLELPEGWMFLSAAFVLAAAGAVVDVAGY